jgi:hypothetical protein
MSVGVPLILIAIELLFPPRVAWKTIVSRVLGFGVISALFLTQFILIGKASGNVVTPHGGSWGAHFFLTAWAQVLYLKQAFLPGDLRLLYCLAPMTGPTDVRLFVIGLVLVVSTGALIFWRRSSHVLFGAVLYFVCLGPASNLVPFPSLMADRYLYAASLGTCLILALALNALPERVRPLSLKTLLLALALSSAWRSSLWHSEETLWAESDEDPECLLDTNFPAAQVHALRAMASRDPETRLLAFERSIASAGYAKMKSCTIPRDGALAALSLNLPERARPFSALSVQHCASEPQTWVIAMAISMHRDKAAAADAAHHAWRLANDPRTWLYKALTELEYVGTGADEVSAAISDDAAQLCPLLMPWAGEVDASVATAVAEPLERCRRLGERGSK